MTGGVSGGDGGGGRSGGGCTGSGGSGDGSGGGIGEIFVSSSKFAGIVLLLFGIASTGDVVVLVPRMLPRLASWSLGFRGNLASLAAVRNIKCM
jgi:hypothetical protein